MIKAELTPPLNLLEEYPYVGYSMTGDEIVLFVTTGTGLILSGAHRYSLKEGLFESLYERIPTPLNIQASNIWNGIYPVVVQNQELLVSVHEYLLYLNEEQFIGFDIDCDGVASFEAVVNDDFGINYKERTNVLIPVSMTFHFDA